MVWVAMKNGSGQVVKGLRIRDISDDRVYLVLSSKRLGINRYRLTLQGLDGSLKEVLNHELKRWEVVGDFLSPEQIAANYGRRRVDPDANLPRPMRESFWAMKSKPGTFNYRQKVRLMQLPEYQKFSKYFETTIEHVLL